MLVVAVGSLLGRGALLLAESEHLGLLGGLLVELGVLPGASFLLVSLGLPLGSSGAAGLLSRWGIAGLAALGGLGRGRLVLLELRVPLGNLPVLLASRDTRVLVDRGAGLAAFEGRVPPRSSSGEGDRSSLCFFLGDFDCVGCKIC